MKKIALALASVLVAGVASAADLPRKGVKAVPVAVPVGMNWTGFYAGLHAGYGQGKASYDVYNLANVYLGSGSVNGKGFFGGIQAGYDWQFGNVVAGLAADYSFGGVKGNNGLGGNISLDGTYSLRARLGYAISNSTLVYATGGYGAGMYNAYDAFASQKKTHGGYVVGAGLEHKFTRNISAFAEYRYNSFGNVSHILLASGVDLRTKADLNSIRAGVNYRF